jgi:IclR helix-turn-helix domain
MPRTTSGDTSQTLGRGLDVLEMVATSPDGLTPAQVASELALSRTIVYRLIGTLIDHRMVRRGSDGVLRAGFGTLKLTQNIAKTLREDTREVLERLADDLSATSHLVIAEGNEALAVSVVEPRNTTFHVAYRAGSRTPLSQGALGLALQAALRGDSGVFESAGQLIPGAKGIVASLPGLYGLPCGIGVVTLAPTDTSSWPDRVQRAADELMAAFLGSETGTPPVASVR